MESGICSLLVFRSAFIFLFLFTLERFLCLLIHLLKYRKRFFILWEKPLQKSDCNRDGHDLLGRERKPKECEIGTSEGKHPTNFVKRAYANENIAPAVCNHPRQAKAQKKARIQQKLQYFFDSGFDFFFCLFSHFSIILICRMSITFIISYVFGKVNRTAKLF